LNRITTDDLRLMRDSEGLILQGCGGDLKEWVDGINKTLTDSGILMDGTKFENISVFEYEGLTNLIFHFEGAKIDVGKLAMWRIRTHNTFGGTWLSDYVPNRLGGFVQSSFEEQIEELYDADTYTSPDFLCDQTEGYPTSLCVNWEQSKAWLALNYSLAKPGEDLSAYEQKCAEFGIRDCHDEEAFNSILRSLGEDALENVELPMEGKDQAMQL